jgi:hypothetical protein
MSIKTLCTSLILGIGVVAAAHFAVAREAGQGRGGGEEHGPGQEHGKKHMHHHMNGHNLLGAKLKQDGKHEVGKMGNRSVTAEVKGGKVANMTAGELSAKRVRTKMKMASLDGRIIPVAWTNGLQLIQYEDYYYGYCFDDGVNFDCYWYPPSDVDYVDYTWDEYDPNY